MTSTEAPPISRRTAVLAALAGGLLLLIATTQTWVTAAGLGDTSAVQQVDIPGTDVADAATAMALVGLAAAVALTIARPLMRRVIGVLLLGAGAFSLYTAISVAVSPGEASLAALGEVTGTTELAGQYETAGAVWLAAAGATVMATAGAVVLLWAGRWKDAAASRKYRRSPARLRGGTAGEGPAGEGTADARTVDEGEADEFDLWDGLSEGEDLTDRR